MSFTHLRPDAQAGPIVHPFLRRFTHWVNALATIIMIMSGWRIYNASPFFGFELPTTFSLGGWLAGALAWHFAAMWLLVANLAFYLLYGLFSGHFWRDFLPIGPASLWRDLRGAFSFRLTHEPGRYNALQRLIYMGVIAVLVLALLSGLSIWKPVQLQELTALMGGFETARRVHFLAMAALVFFIIGHIALAVASKGVLMSMITGRGPAPEAER
jgi:thiosulfate reductase cytochrome b subunit